MMSLPHGRSPLNRLTRTVLVMAGLLCLMSQSLIAVGCEVHDLSHGSEQQVPHETADSDSCHTCCGSMGSGHLCAHGVMLTSTSYYSAFVAQAVLTALPSSTRTRAQFIPPGMFRPPIAV